MPINIQKEPQYHISCKINDIDMTSELMTVKILRLFDSPYSVYVLKFKTDTDKRKFFDNINPEMTITLNIQVFLEQPNPSTIWEVKLAYILDESELPYKYNTYNQESDKQIVWSELTILAIPLQSLKSCITPLQNQIFFNKTLQSIIENIKTDTIDYVTPIENNNTIDQYIIEKQSFMKEIDKLNFYYGLYKGPYFKFHNEFTNSWKLGSLTKSFNIQPYIEMEFVSINSFNKEYDSKVIESFGQETGEYFYTTDNISLENATAKYVTKESFNIRYVTYPKDKLYNENKFNLQTDILQQHAPIDKSLDLKINSILKQKYKNYFDHLGFEYDNTLFTNYITNKTKDLSSIVISLKKLIDLQYMWPGRIVMFKTKHMRYIKLTGKYFINNIDIEFTRADTQTWQSRTNLKLSRTNTEF